MKLLEGNFPLCIENKNATGPFLDTVPKQYCNQTLWFDSTDGTFRPSTDVVNESIMIIMMQVFAWPLDSIPSLQATQVGHRIAQLFPWLVCPIPKTTYGWSKILQRLGSG